MPDAIIPLVLLHASSARIVEIGARITSEYADLSVVGNLSSVADLAATPDIARAIVLTDSTPTGDAGLIDRVRVIRSLGARVVVLGASDFPAGVVPAMAAGADAVLPPESSVRRVAEQVRLVANRAQLMKSQSDRQATIKP